MLTFFLGLHLLLGENLDVCGRVDLFFYVCGRVALFFSFFLWSSLILGGNWTSVLGTRSGSKKFWWGVCNFELG